VKNHRKPALIALSAFCLLSFVACGEEHATDATDERTVTLENRQVSREEISTYVDWAAELRKQMIAGMAEAQQKMNDDDALVRMFERRRAEQQEILGREPFKGTTKGDAMRGVIQTAYDSGRFRLHAKELDKLRATYGNELIDSILEHETVIRRKLDPDGLSVQHRVVGAAGH
jgi:hypothetical protein